MAIDTTENAGLLPGRVGWRDGSSSEARSGQGTGKLIAVGESPAPPTPPTPPVEPVEPVIPAEPTPPIEPTTPVEPTAPTPPSPDGVGVSDVFGWNNGYPAPDPRTTIAGITVGDHLLGWSITWTVSLGIALDSIPDSSTLHIRVKYSDGEGGYKYAVLVDQNSTHTPPNGTIWNWYTYTEAQAAQSEAYYDAWAAYETALAQYEIDYAQYLIDQAQYEADMIQYAADLAQYNIDLAAYNDAVADHAQWVIDYAAYLEALAAYEAALIAYNYALAEYLATYGNG